MNIYNSLAPVTEEDLIAFENSIGYQLPSPYRNFLKKHNGGFINSGNFRYDEDGTKELGGVHDFFGIGNKSDYLSFQKRFKYGYRNFGLPERLLPIGGSGIGNFVCISVSGSDIGKIYFMQHEITSENEENIFLIADDFDSFLEILFKFEIYEYAFPIENGERFQCRIDYYTGQELFVRVSDEDEFLFYLGFGAVSYISCPIHWVGANFEIAPSEALKEIFLAMGYDEERADKVISWNHDNLYIASIPSLNMKIIAMDVGKYNVDLKKLGF